MTRTSVLVREERYHFVFKKSIGSSWRRKWICAIYSCFEKGCRKKVHATIPKGNLGYDQLILISQINTSNQWCLLLLLSFSTRKHTSMVFLAIFSEFPEMLKSCWSQGTVNVKLPTIPFGIVACAFLRQPFSKQLYIYIARTHASVGLKY